MNYTSRSMVTAPRKRKDRGETKSSSSFYKGSHEKSHHRLFSSVNNSTNHNASNTTLSSPTTSRTLGTSFNSSNRNSGSSNLLLAGYMAHEFLTKGTLLGQNFDPLQAKTVPVSRVERKRPLGKISHETGSKPHNYVDMAQLLKIDGVHIPGIVNPTQLARWMQM